MESELLLHFEKEVEEIPWGFRLTGGVDFNEPLTVVKVCEGSVAENVGMKVGDVLIRINDLNTSDLTHAEAHDVILSGNCNFTITVKRGEKTEVEITAEETDKEENETSRVNENQETSETIQKESDLNITDEEIVQIIQGEQQNDETSSSIRTSDVYQAVKEEDVQILETRQDAKKWSTFLQKPDKPIRKSKPKEEPAEEKAPGYQVVIKKQKRRSFESAVALLQEEDKLLSNTEEVTIKSDLPINQTEEADLIQRQSDMTQEPDMTEQTNREDTVIDIVEPVANPDQDLTQDYQEIEDISKQLISGNKRRQKTAKGSQSIEEQLAQVQEQLLALSRLPSTIQSTLNAVTRQLEKIASAAHFVEGEDDEHSYEATTTTEDEITEPNTDGMLSTVIEEPNEEIKEVDTEDERIEKDTDKENVDAEVDTEGTISEGAIATEETKRDEAGEDIDEELTLEEREEMRIQREIQLLEEKKQKDVQVLQVLEEQCQRRLEEKPALPLTPLERPIILPGGRKWCEPEDVLPKLGRRKMSDDSINQTIQTYSEVLVGRLKGINFLKYQPPPKNLDHLQRSAVYKMIHDMEPPSKGISTRTEKILAAEDYLKKQEES